MTRTRVVINIVYNNPPQNLVAQNISHFIMLMGSVGQDFRQGAL